MLNFLKKIVLWFYVRYISLMNHIGIGLYYTESEILKADPNNIDEKDKRIQRKLHRNPVIEKFYAGQRDEQYAQDYYETLKKADRFMKKSTQHKMAVAADKHGTNYGLKDQYGRRYEHYGFFDDKHKHSGKTMGEVLELEFEERRTKDDDYELLYIYDNKPIEVSLNSMLNVAEDGENDIFNNLQKSKKFKFPISITRKNKETINKIEELSEFLHVKKIGFEYRLLEFFIPLKFKTNEIPDDSDVFKEILDLGNVYIRNEYNELKGFGIMKFIKRITHNNMYDVWKFEGIEMDNV